MKRGNAPIIRDAAFAARLTQAADRHPHCPPMQRGRYPWVRDRLAEKGVKSSIEGLRKWFIGENKPSPETTIVLADILGVDQGWLYMGVDPNLAPREKRARNAMASGAVNLIAGMIQMDGGTPAFPADDDDQAERNNVDLYAIIRGANYSLHVTLGDVEPDTDEVLFIVPTIHQNVTVIGVIRDGMNFELFEITPEVIEENGKGRGGSIEARVSRNQLRRIEGFTQRF